MVKASAPPATAWAFRARLRRGAFGWRGTRLAISRLGEALSEIRAVARHDPAAAGEGAVLLLEKLWPAKRRLFQNGVQEGREFESRRPDQ